MLRDQAKKPRLARMVPGDDAPEDVEDQHSSDEVDSALNEGERPSAPDANADPETGGAENDA